MTDAKIARNPAAGHGLSGDLLDAIYDEMAKGKEPGLIPALVLFQPVEHGGKKTANGRKRTVVFDIVRLEPVLNAADADRVRLDITEAYEARHDTGQGALDLGEEDARRYLGYLEEWRKERSLTVKALGELWREHFGEESTVPGDYRKAGAAALYEFCLTNKVLPDEVAGGPADPSDGS